MLGVWNSLLSPRPVNMPRSEELEGHEKLTWHPQGKSSDRPADRYRPVISRFTVYKRCCNLSRRATTPGDPPGTHPRPPFRDCLSPCILCPWYSLEALPEPHR